MTGNCVLLHVVTFCCILIELADADDYGAVHTIRTVR